MTSQTVSECRSESYGIVLEYTDSIQLQELGSWQMSNAFIWTSTPPLKQQQLKDGSEKPPGPGKPSRTPHNTHIQLCKGTAMAMDYMAKWEETKHPYPRIYLGNIWGIWGLTLRKSSLTPLSKKQSFSPKGPKEYTQEQKMEERPPSTRPWNAVSDVPLQHSRTEANMPQEKENTHKKSPHSLFQLQHTS